MSYRKKLLSASLGMAAMLGTAALAQDAPESESYVEIDPAPSGVEMHELHVYNNIMLGLPGADSGIVYDGGFDSSGNHINVFDFSNGGGVGGGGGGGGGRKFLDDATIHFYLQ